LRVTGIHLLTAEQVKATAFECGFELAGITPALPHSDYARFEEWRGAGYAGEMKYLTDHRGDLRADPRFLLSEARSLLCVGKLYHSPYPHTEPDPSKGWISRYAWGEDYHDVLRTSLEELMARLQQIHGEPFSYRICVDTAPLLERSYARSAGLGWIGKNTCLINQGQGSWFFLGSVLLSVDLEADRPPPDRCGTCTRCIDACPTQAIVPSADGTWTLDARACISYLTIEKRGPFDASEAAKIGNHIFGCDICQDVCPWNRRAPTTGDKRFWPMTLERDLLSLSRITPDEFRNLFRKSPIKRAKHEGFVRNIAAALGAVSLAASLSAATDPLQNPGFEHFYNLEYDAALQYFEQQLKQNPNDSSQYNHVAQIILYRQMYREGALNTDLVSASNSFLKRPKLRFSEADRKELTRMLEHVLSNADKANDVETLYNVGVAYGLRANYLFLGEKDYIGALKAAALARKTNDQVLEKDPKFVDARLIPGLYKYVVGSLPFYMRLLSFLGGFQGDIEGGIRDLEEVRTHGVTNRYDAEILLAAIYRREHQPNKAIPLLEAAAQRFPRNPLLHSELATVRKEAQNRRP
jgi:epoxyqueuosine reductase